jgi:hypothetical protein
MNLVLGSSKKLWADAVETSESLCQPLPYFAKQYLIETLSEYTRRTDLREKVSVHYIVTMSDEFKREGIGSREKRAKLTDFGNICLLVSGFFPERTLRLNVSKTYFSDFGETVFTLLGNKKEKDVFFEVETNFRKMVRVIEVITLTQDRVVQKRIISFEGNFYTNN